MPRARGHSTRGGEGEGTRLPQPERKESSPRGVAVRWIGPRVGVAECGCLCSAYRHYVGGHGGCKGGGGVAGDGPGACDLPAKRLPLLVPGTKGSHPCDCVPTPWGGSAAGPEVEPDSLLPPPPPLGCLSGTCSMVRVLRGSGGHGEETNRRATAMMLSPGRPAVRVTPPTTASPSWWGPAGTMGLASRCALPGDRTCSCSSLSLSLSLCVCVCVCVCGWVGGWVGVGGWVEGWVG